jgi:hypothetical protein
VGAVCPNWARTALCGGREVTRVPTAIQDPKPDIRPDGSFNVQNEGFNLFHQRPIPALIGISGANFGLDSKHSRSSGLTTGGLNVARAGSRTHRHVCAC